ncbi:MAG: MBL fold metallo-hydrolase, partial [Anaerovoracaceae bacterium]
ETILVVHTPGHTRGGVCYYSEKSKLAFTGDTIFNVDLGRTDLEDGNQRALEASIGEKIALWSNEIVIYPGHGDSCTMSYVKKHNEEVKEILGRK